MAGFNGSGTFVRSHDWTTDLGNAIAVTASRMDTEHDGFATGLSSVICKDGQTTTTARIPFAVGLSIGSSATIELGHATDTTIDRGTAGAIRVEGEYALTSMDMTAIYSTANKTQLRTNIGAHKRTLSTVQVITSATAIAFSDVPTGTFRVDVMILGLAVNSSSVPLLQIGDSGGMEATGYVGSRATVVNGATGNADNHDTGFEFGTTATSVTLSGIITLETINAGTIWTMSGVLGVEGNESSRFLGGYKAIDSALTQLRLYIDGTVEFNAGQVNVAYYHT